MTEQMAIYETGNKSVKFNIDAAQETIWATQAQIAELFDVTTQNIAIHFGKIYNDGELEKDATCKEYLQVQKEGNREVSRKVKTYNLDAIISVGYRVSSRKATDFRIWATKVLKRYIVKGVAVNEQRLEELSYQKLQEVSGVLDVVKRIMAHSEFSEDEAKGVLEVITKYGRTFATLREYDDGQVRLNGKKKLRMQKMLEAGDAMTMIAELKKAVHGGEMFGRPRGDEFEGILRTIYQSFGGEEMYPGVAAKAAHLLYFIIKDHPFFDGNKRIASLLFIIFLTMNKFDLTKRGETKISDRTLTALALMIAESDPREKGLMTAVVEKLLEEV